MALQASVRVDGRSVGVRSSLRQHRATTVAGFLVAEGKHNQEQRFVFAKPSTRGADIAAALQRKDSLAGRISVVFREEGGHQHTPLQVPARGLQQPGQPLGWGAEHSLSCQGCRSPAPRSPHPSDAQGGQHAGSQEGAACAGPACCSLLRAPADRSGAQVEGQKWFQRPSLATAAGELVPSAIVLSANPYEKGRQLCEAHLYVETATVLRLRKVLDDSRPEHRAILQQFMEQVADDDGDCQPAAAPAVAAVQPGAVVKAETGEVPRQQAAAGQPAAAQPGVEVKPEVSKRPRLGRQAKAIDLTGRSPSKQLTVDLT